MDTTQQGASISGSRLPGKIITIVIGCIVLLIFSTELVWRHHAQRLAVRACFADAGQLKEGSRVYVAGVKVGYVSRMSTHPSDGACAVEAEMVLDSSYQFNIPADSTISLATAASGQTQANIHIENASGPPLEQGGMLKSLPSRE
jgi:ABC-type transporter Mla subunit MlaD